MTRSAGLNRTAALAGVALVTAACSAAPDGAAPSPRSTAPASTYWVYVGAESADLLHRIRFGPDGAVVERTVDVGRIPTEVEGPHGLAISRDGRHLYMTTGHGVPTGHLWKYALGPDTLVADEVPLGAFPATLDVTPDGLFALVVNFNLHGDHVPSSVSVVYTPDMVEIERTATCTMPHGSRINVDGTAHYSACMMDDLLVEIETRSFRVARRFSVAAGQEGPVHGDPHEHTDHAGPMQGMRGGAHAQPSCSPTWAQPSVDGTRVYVACNRSDRVHEIEVAGWRVTRTFETGRAPYNIETTADGRLLIVTLKGGAAVEFIDIASGRTVARTPTTTTVVHGVVASPDSRYAFVSVEGVGAEPGKVDIYDLRSYRLVASVEVGQQAGGIAFWRME